jgi:hypothetical protein
MLIPKCVARSLVAGATALLLLAAGPAAAQIRVDVNGRPVQFGAVQPARVSGRVLIPLRAVVESLGADIRWDGATQTVRGSKGSREFSLQIGSRNVIVNGGATMLDVPAQLVSGTTMVPLRFVAEALGAEVEWRGADQRVVINTPVEREEPGTGRVTGEVVAVRPQDTPPTLTVTVDGVRQTYRVRGDTIILRGEEGQRGAAVDLAQLRPGDRVQLRLTADAGTAEVIEAFYARGAAPPDPVSRAVTGEVEAVRTAGGQRTIVVRTETGRETFTVPARTPISRAVGDRPAAAAELNDVQVGDQVRLTVDPQGQQVTRLEAAARAPAAAREVTGEVVAVRETAPASITIRSGNDRASYDIRPNTVLLRRGADDRSARVTLKEIQPGDQVTIQLDPTGAVARVVEATPALRDVDLQPSPDLRITSLTHDGRADQPLRAGTQVRVTMVGTPGATASVDVGTLTQDVRLREDPQRPGRYTGSFSVPRNVTAREVTLIGQLRKGNQTSPLLQAPGALTVDSEPPAITDVAPADKATVNNRQPDIYAEITDGDGSGIDRASLRMLVRGEDVTQDAKLTNRFVLYTPKSALPAGQVPVVLSLRDQAGNPAEGS